MSSLGPSTTFIGAVGSDSNAKLLRDRYRQYGVRARLCVDTRGPTGSTMALTWSTRKRALVTDPGANARLKRRDVPVQAIRGAHHVHRSGFWWTSGLVGKPTATLLARARRHGATTSLDVSTDPRGWPEAWIVAVRICLPHVDVFFGNETEVCAVAGEQSPIQAGKRLRSFGAAEVVIHQGDRGAAAITSSGVVRSPAFDVAIDNPTEYGEDFKAAYADTRLTQASVIDRLRHWHAGDASFNGVTPAGCAANLVRRYTGPGELVVDPMAGSGTIGDVARALGRRAVSFDLAPRRPHILRADARSWPLSPQTAALAVIDSPYSDNVVYSPDSRCLGRISCRDARFYVEMEKVAWEAYRVLRPGGILAWIIADEYRAGVYTPVGFRLLGFLEKRFEPIDTIVLVRHHDRSASPMWEHRARRFNFFLRGFKFLLLLRKPFDEPGG